LFPGCYRDQPGVSLLKPAGDGVPSAGRLAVFAGYLKIEHTLFSVPLIYAGALLADAPLTLRTGLLILIAATGARTTALGLNRILDRRLDAHNPRTASRALPSGAMSLAEAGWFLVASTLVYLSAAWAISLKCLVLTPIPLIVFTVYPLLKRFTRWAHLGVGVGLALGPLGAFYATGLEWRGVVPALLLALFTVFWSSGFDILYATLDEDSDRKQGVHSLPASLGAPAALRVAAVFHLVAFAFLLALHYQALEGFAALLFFLLAGGLFLVQHHFRAHVNFAFFQMNSLLGFVVFLGVASSTTP